MVKWEKDKLRNHIDLLAGFAFKSKSFTDDKDDTPLVKGENVHQGYIDWENAKRWKASEFEELKKFSLDVGDVVIAMDRPWIEAGLKYAWIRPTDPKSLLVQRVARLRGKNGLITDYLRYLIGSSAFTDYIKPIVTGVSVPHISGDQIKDFIFMLPPVDIQQKISSILSVYDDLIENTIKRIKILEEMSQMIYREWFVKFRFQGHEKVKMVESEVGMIPEGWEVKTVNDIANVTDYVANGSFATLKQNVTYLDKAGYAILIRVKDFNNGWNGNYVYVSEHSYNFLRKTKLQPFDIVIGNVGSVGVIFLVPDLGQPMTIGPNSVLIQPFENRFYYYNLFASDCGQHLMRGITSGVAQPKFNKTDLRNSKLIIPRSDIGVLFNEKVTPIYSQIEQLRRICVNLRKSRDLLLPKLISGEIDVKNLAIKVQEELINV